MSATLATVIMAHPRRRARAELLAEFVGAKCIIWDHKAEGEWSTGARAWSAGAEYGATHTLVLQDDAEPVSDLERYVLEAVELAPKVAISLYLGQKKPSRWAPNVALAVQEADAVGAGFIASSHLLHGVGIVLPTPWITPMLQWAEMSTAPYDQRIGAYVRQIQGKGTLYTWPSLVDHDDTIPSLVRHIDDSRLSPEGRIAYRTGAPPQRASRTVVVETPPGAEA